MDENEWPLIVRLHSPLVWRTAIRLLSNEADAADCLQETFLCAWNFSRRQRVTNWPGLLQRLSTARALDQLRRRRRQAKHLGADPEMQDTVCPEAGPLAQLQSTELAEQLRLALADLPPLQSQVYCLRHLNGFSYEQIAGELEMTVSAVGVNLHRATQRLRTALTPILNEKRNLR